MRRSCLAMAAILGLAALLPARAEPPRLPLWEGDAPQGDGTFAAAPKAAITVHLPERPTGAAAVICPGGGYGGLVTGAEGHGIAAWLNRHGIAGIVLEYRLPAGRPFVPLLDAQRALRLVRLHAAEWKIDPHRLGIIGFSAGGHLASTAATHFDAGRPDATEPVERESSRPDFVILVYPVITMKEQGHAGSRRNLLGPEPAADMVELFSNELQVTKDCPPAFLAHAVDDKPVPIENSILFYDAQRARGLPAKLLRLPAGGHGLSGYKGPSWDAWQAAAIDWLHERRMIP
jgi:acetyl esterase/lipase